MKQLLLALFALLMSACAPSKNGDAPTPELTYDFVCTAKHEGRSISYRYRLFQMDASAYNMGIRNFVKVEAQVDDRFNSMDINEDGNTLELQKMYYEKQIYVNTIHGAYRFTTDWSTNGNVDSTIVAELMGLPITLTDINCLK